MDEKERLLGALLADVVQGGRDGLIDFAIRAGVNEKHLGPEGGRIWSAIKQLKRSGRPFDLRDVAKTVNEDKDDPVREDHLWDLAGPGSSQGPYLIREVVGRALLKETAEKDAKLDIQELTKRLALVDEEARLPAMEDFGTLLETELPLLDWIVQDMVVRPGLTFLAGRSKAGKSWLALQLAHCVATGQDFLGRSVRQGMVLYLALEDGRRRTQGRLKKQGWETSGGRAVIGVYGGIQLDEPGRKVLARMVEEVEPSLVVIDALAKVLPEGVNENDNARMAQILYPVSDLANDRGCSIVTVHHHGKGATGDVIGYDMRGASSIYAAGDGVIGLYPGEGRTNEARLAVQGRDIEDVEMAIGWTGSGWSYIGGVEVLGQREAKRKVIKALCELVEATAAEIAGELHIHFSTARKALEEMVGEGMASRREGKTQGRPATIYTYTL